MSEEKRIYAVVAETVWTPDKGVVVQVPGRMAAQACHAVSRMRMHRLVASKPGVSFKSVADEEITTIVLSCRDGKELAHVKALLNDRRVKWWGFDDTNPEVYGGCSVPTALATVPVPASKVRGALDYLPLWSPRPNRLTAKDLQLDVSRAPVVY